MSRARQSTASVAPRASAALSLPPYEPPQHALTLDAQRDIQALAARHNLAKLKSHLQQASDCVTENAGDINDVLYRHTERHQRRAARQSQDDEREDDDKDLEVLKDKVDIMTSRMEESVRKTIDGQNNLSGVEEALRQAQQVAAASATQATQQSQRRRDEEDDDDDGDTQMSDINPTMPGTGVPGTQIAPSVAPSAVFSKNIQTSKDRYYDLSLKTRYAQHNSYVGFKKIVHDAQYPGEDAPPLPHYSTWFNEEGSPAPGETRAGAGVEDESDDDVAIARVSISTKCPLTLREFVDPVTSKKCPHSFERMAITEMISGNRGRVTQCPVPGCSQHLTIKDLHTDSILVRKIRRIQQSRRAGDEDGDETMADGKRPLAGSRIVDLEDDSSGDEIE